MTRRPLAPLCITALCLAALALPSVSLARRGPAPASANGLVKPLESVPVVALSVGKSLEALVAEADLEQSREGTPNRFAQRIEVHVTPATHGTWEMLPDGARLWRARVHAPDATDLNLGFTRFRLPPGATLHVSSESHDYWEGPYTHADNQPEGQLWLPATPGDRAVLELYVPPAVKFEPELELWHVGYGFRDFFRFEPRLERQGACNNDVICPEGDPWRDEIASVGVYQLNGQWTCTGSMVMNTNGDFTPYFLTANHCGISGGNANTMVVYWNFEAPNCGDLCCGDLSDNQTGAIFRAAYSPSDFCLVELSDDPDPASNVYWAGWDNSGVAPGGCTAIHHPGTDEKAISFNTNALTVTSCLSDPSPGDGTHWRIDDWEDGTTEPGSSGSGIWDPAHRLVGQLHGGFASCSSITEDWYGRISVSWNGGGTASTSLKAWLDPGITGAVTQDGSFPEGIFTQAVAFDDECPSGAGNMNGIVEPGELLTLPVTVRASGSQTGVSGVLSTTTPGVTILDDTATWPNLLDGQSSPSDAPHFQVVLDPTVACLSQVDFDLSISSNEGGPYLSSFTEDVGQAPAPGGLPVAIPDNNASGVTHVFSVAENHVLTDLDVRVEIAHTFVGDLKIELESPAATRITLLDRPGVPASTYGCGNNDMNVTFDDASGFDPESYCAGNTPWYVGPAAPVGLLSAFNGESTMGDWKLIVSDNAGADTGSIIDWELLGTPPLNGQCDPCNVGTDAPVAVAPSTRFGLANAAPNPFRGDTRIRFSLDRPAATRLEIFDLAGRRVDTLVDREMAAGSHVVSWDGRDSAGNMVASGIYFYRLSDGERSDMKRMSRIR